MPQQEKMYVIHHLSFGYSTCFDQSAQMDKISVFPHLQSKALETEE